MTLRYIDAVGETLEEMREHARSNDLYKHGDMKLIWVNEGDLCTHMVHSYLAQPPIGNLPPIEEISPRPLTAGSIEAKDPSLFVRIQKAIAHLFRPSVKTD